MSPFLTGGRQVVPYYKPHLCAGGNPRTFRSEQPRRLGVAFLLEGVVSGTQVSLVQEVQRWNDADLHLGLGASKGAMYLLRGFAEANPTLDSGPASLTCRG